MVKTDLMRRLWFADRESSYNAQPVVVVFSPERGAEAVEVVDRAFGADKVRHALHDDYRPTKVYVARGAEHVPR